MSFKSSASSVYAFVSIKLIRVLGIGLACLGFAQFSYANQENSEDIERLIVSGQYADLALGAFNSGNYSVAEVKFKENAECALRAELMQADAFESMQLAQTNQTAQAESLAPSPGSNSNQGGASASVNTVSSPSSGMIPNTDFRIRERTCENRSFQIYMVGMSQLKLGRTDEAEANLEKAITIDKYLYDAQYRLALIKLLRGETKPASKHLSHIESALDRCHRCDFRDKIDSRMKFLKQALAGTVKLQ